VRKQSVRQLGDSKDEHEVEKEFDVRDPVAMFALAVAEQGLAKVR
jgi:hypothetical protein